MQPTDQARPPCSISADSKKERQDDLRHDTLDRGLRFSPELLRPLPEISLMAASVGGFAFPSIANSNAHFTCKDMEMCLEEIASSF